MGDADTYTVHMTRGAGEPARLEEQWELYTQSLGYLVHPSIAEKLPPDARIADIGTGTGIFLRRVSEIYPQGTLDGFDISEALFPDQATLPPNVTLSVLDAKKPIPPELHGTYDFVNVRLLSAALLPAEWKYVVANVSQLLKPGGGALQWVESNFLGSSRLRARVDSTVSAVNTMNSLILDAFREHFINGWSTLVEDMTDAGLVRVQRDVVSTDRLPELRPRVTANSMVACFGWARSGKDPVPLSAEQLDELERQAYRDIESGGYARWDIHASIGFRP